MPLPMVHLGVAVRYFEGGGVPEAFALGSIAPDAIHMRAGACREDKVRTHFGGKETTPDILEREYASYLGLSDEPEWRVYVQGYFAHVLTDYLWGQSVYEDFKRRTEQDGLPPGEIKNTYYVDTDGIDFRLYETSAWTDEIRAGLLRVPARGVPPLLTEREVDEWRLRTLHWFEEPAHRPESEPKYVTMAIVEDFIRQTGDATRDAIREWEARLERTGGHRS
ncbi:MULTISPECIES: hypothetical protein [Saccharibacillus]|uniref:hypothetical protein n=1 Tax=Saccharibacillus TaxID=456492 RepID=UPI00123B3CDC|nr:hypothetical protein [Saccharibacillus sp. WB 17]MWJ31394.1 hypothetical protein [Saccharibacillus sp. WB 17]